VFLLNKTVKLYRENFFYDYSYLKYLEIDSYVWQSIAETVYFPENIMRRCKIANWKECIREHIFTLSFFLLPFLILYRSITAIMLWALASRLTVKMFYKKDIRSSGRCCARLYVWLRYNSWKLPKLFRMLQECRRTTKTKRIIPLFSLGLYLFLVLGD